MAYDLRTFADKISIGRSGEMAAINFLTSTGWEVEDVAKNPDYFDKGYDLCARKNGRECHIEVKTDNRISSTGNLCVEEISNYETNKKGWIYTGEDDTRLFIYVPQTHQLYITQLGVVREQLTQARPFFCKEWEGSYLKTAVLRLIPWNSLPENKTFIIDL